MFKGPQETVRDSKNSSYPVFELLGVNCSKNVADTTFNNIRIEKPISIPS